MLWWLLKKNIWNAFNVWFLFSSYCLVQKNIALCWKRPTMFWKIQHWVQSKWSKSKRKAIVHQPHIQKWLYAFVHRIYLSIYFINHAAQLSKPKENALGLCHLKNTPFKYMLFQFWAYYELLSVYPCSTVIYEPRQFTVPTCQSFRNLWPIRSLLMRTSL